MGDRVSGQHVLITTHDDPRHGELVDEFCDRGRHMLGVRLAVWTGTRVSELMQVGGRFGIHAQRPGNRLEDFGGGFRPCFDQSSGAARDWFLEHLVRKEQST